MANTVLLEARPFRPFKSSEEYLYAMKEDLAEWLNTLYPEIGIHVDNFMDKIETGVVLCKHANNVKQASIDYITRRQARDKLSKSTTPSSTATLAQNISTMSPVHYLQIARPGTFFARDNVSNFIHWCRKFLDIYECLLFETDDLILRKNEKHVILCLLEVARKGAKIGMLAPMLVQMERQIDREIAHDHGQIEDTDSEDEREPSVIMVYGPQPQIITNDLKSLDEMVRDLVEKCSCPTQFPMIRVSEGKYRIGDTKVLIFVRILRSHVMVRVGGGWDTLSHYLDKHDPCRCRTQHRTSLQSKLIRPAMSDLVGAQVLYDRRPSNSSLVKDQTPQQQQINQLLTPTVASRNRSRSPTPSRAKTVVSSTLSAPETLRNRRSVSPNTRSPLMPRKNLNLTLSPPLNARRSQSPTGVGAVNGTASTIGSKICSNFADSTIPTIPNVPPIVCDDKESKDVKEPQSPEPTVPKQEPSSKEPEGSGSDNGSEVSDEGYRSLGLIQNATTPETAPGNRLLQKLNRLLLNVENALDDADFAGHSSQIESEVAAIDDFQKQTTIEEKEPEQLEVYNETGLRKTYFSETYFNDKKPETTTIQKPKTKSTDYSTATIRSRSSSQDRGTITPDESPLTRTFAYRSMREKTAKEPAQKSPAKIVKPITPAKFAQIKSEKNPLAKSASTSNNTWSGRAKTSRPALSQDTFTPKKSPQNFARNGYGRASLSRVQYDSNGRRIIKSNASTSANTSPIKQQNKSPLVERIIKMAEESQSEEQVLEKIKDVLRQYSNYDFTTAWVNSHDGSGIGAMPAVSDTKRASIVSESSGSDTGSKQGMSSLPYVSPRKDTKIGKIGLGSKIPMPVSYKRSTTDLF